MLSKWFILTLFPPQWSGLKTALPSNVNLLTLEPWVGGDILLRLEHFFEGSDDDTLGQSANLILEVNLQNV
jgi:hypothetical protein